jgi:hypothetical protein
VEFFRCGRGFGKPACDTTFGNGSFAARGRVTMVTLTMQ